MQRPHKRVENYTNAFLVTVAVILFMAFFTLAATVGFVWVILSAALIETLLRLHEARVSNR